MERKVALVTGSSKGIGKGIILEFAKNGYDVVINYNHSFDSAYSLKEVVEQEYGVKTLVVQCDVSNENEVIDIDEKGKKQSRLKGISEKAELEELQRAIENQDEHGIKQKQEDEEEDTLRLLLPDQAYPAPL